MDEKSEKKTIKLLNQGKRPWTLKDAEGVTRTIDSREIIELDETAALRLLLDYPRDFIKASDAGPSSRDIARMEQSIRDRTANLDKREKELDEREKAAPKVDVPENVEKLVDKIAVECLLDETDEHPRSFCTSKAAEIITAFLAEQSKDKEPSDEPTKKRGRPAASKAEGEK